MIKEEVDLVLPLFEGMENGRVERRVLTNWVVRPIEFHLKIQVLTGLLISQLHVMTDNLFICPLNPCIGI